VLLYSICYSFCSAHKSGSVVSERSALHLFFFVHVPDKIWVQEVGTRTSRAFARSVMRRARQQLMGDEKKDDGAGDPFKMLLEESLARQRNEMMDNFAQILRRLPTGDTSSSSGHATPFKVQVNFDIPLFEGLIDADVVDKWLNLLEGYFSVHNFFDREKITFALLKVVPHVKDWWDTYSEQRAIEESAIFVVAPTWDSFRDSIKEQYYPVGSYEDQYTRWTTLRQERDQTVPDFTNIFHTLRTKLGIKDSE
jgi:hypothetical protein